MNIIKISKIWQCERSFSNNKKKIKYHPSIYVVNENSKNTRLGFSTVTKGYTTSVIKDFDDFKNCDNFFSTLHVLGHGIPHGSVAGILFFNLQTYGLFFFVKGFNICNHS